MIKIERARLREPADVEDRVLWGVAFDAGEMTVNGRVWQTRLALDDLGWLHVWRTNSDKETKHARIPPEMIRIVIDAEAEKESDRTIDGVAISDPGYRHPKAIKR